MAEQPRVWTLLGEHGAHAVLGEKLPPFHRVRVIELEPILDLLERLIEPGEPPHAYEAERDAQNILAAHNRGEGRDG